MNTHEYIKESHDKNMKIIKELANESEIKEYERYEKERLALEIELGTDQDSAPEDVMTEKEYNEQEMDSHTHN